MADNFSPAEWESSPPPLTEEELAEKKKQVRASAAGRMRRMRQLTTTEDNQPRPPPVQYNGGDHRRRTSYGGDQVGRDRRTSYGGDQVGRDRTSYGGDHVGRDRTSYGGDHVINVKVVEGLQVPTTEVLMAVSTPAPGMKKQLILPTDAIATPKPTAAIAKPFPTVEATSPTYTVRWNAKPLVVSTVNDVISLHTVYEVAKKWEGDLRRGFAIAGKTKASLLVDFDASGVIWTTVPQSQSLRNTKSLFHLLKPTMEKATTELHALFLDDINATVPVSDGLKSLEDFGKVFKTAPLNRLSVAGVALAGEVGVKKLKNLIRRPTLEHLDLSNTGSNECVPETLAKLLGGGAPPALKSLAFSRNAMEEDGAQGMGALLPHLKNLQCLEYSSCHPGAAGTVALLDGLKLQDGQSGTLKSLNLSGAVFKTNEQGTDVDKAIQSLSEVILGGGLEELILQDASLGPSGVVALVRCIISMVDSQIKVLDLSENCATNRDEVSLTSVSSPSLSSSGSPAGSGSPEGSESESFMTESTGSATTFRASKALAEGLFAQAHASKLSKLTSLNLASNLLGDEWVARMVPSLLSLPVLQDLDISSNLLGNATLDCLGGQILRHSPGSLALRSLNIGKNRFQDIQTAGLVNICMGHLQLECLNLETTFSGTYVSEELLQDSSDWPVRTVVVVLNGNPNLPHVIQLQDKYPNVVVDNDQRQNQVVQQPRLSEDSMVPVRDIFVTDTTGHQTEDQTEGDAMPSLCKQTKGDAMPSLGKQTKGNAMLGGQTEEGGDQTKGDAMLGGQTKEGGDQTTGEGKGQTMEDAKLGSTATKEGGSQTKGDTKLGSQIMGDANGKVYRDQTMEDAKLGSATKEGSSQTMGNTKGDTKLCSQTMGDAKGKVHRDQTKGDTKKLGSQTTKGTKTPTPSRTLRNRTIPAVP